MTLIAGCPEVLVDEMMRTRNDVARRFAIAPDQCGSQCHTDRTYIGLGLAYKGRCALNALEGSFRSSPQPASF